MNKSTCAYSGILNNIKINDLHLHISTQRILRNIDDSKDHNLGEKASCRKTYIWCNSIYIKYKTSIPKQYIFVGMYKQ